MDDGWDKFYRHVIEEAGRLVNEKLDWFRVSLGDWLYGQLNWPTDDWQQQLDLLVEHTRYYGLIIQPDCVQALHDLVEARVKGTGAFSQLGPYGAQQRRGATAGPIQIAAAVALDDGTRTDATVPLDSGPTPTMKDGREVAGPGPATTASFQKKVHAALAILDVEVAIWWNRAAGEIRSRAASGWTTFLRSNEKYFVEDGKPIVLVDENYTVALTAAAIIRGTVRMGPFRDLFDQDRIPGPDEATRYAEVQERRFREAAAIAAAIAETYLATLGSLTPAGELIVTVDDVSQHGIRWDHLLILLPALAYLRKNIKLLTIKLPGGRQLRLSGHHLEALQKLDRGKRKALIAKAQKAESEAEALAIIKRGVGASSKGPGHHIATNKNWVSMLRGGPWTPRFQRIFDRAGMNLTDVENIVRIPGHRGPHPEQYHREIYRRLTTAVKGRTGDAYKATLVAELRAIAAEAVTRGTKLNRLLTN
jgi:A nuclease family of the HNH/ENDO VII superfamily with conserved AHH